MRWLLGFAYCLIIVSCSAQKYDYNWMAGYDSFAGYDSSATYHFGISRFDFNSDSVSVSYDSLGINFTGTSAEISDSRGEIQFYTNGITIRNRWDEIVENGDSLSNGYYLKNFFRWYAYGDQNNMLFQSIPNPIDSNKFDLFYIFMDTTNAIDPVGTKLLHTQIQMDANQGKGSVNFKDRTIAVENVGPGLAAVKHANGRDWWLCTLRENAPVYDLYLYDGGDITKSFSQETAGFTYHLLETSFIRFSPDGKWMMSADNEQGRLDFFHFDRCNGTLTLAEDIYLPEVRDSLRKYLMAGGEFSSSSRFAYVCVNAKLYQFDLEDSVISSSKTVVGQNSNNQIGLGPLTYYHAQLAPDGKIYINSSNTINFIACINSPDSAGGACQLKDTGWQLPSIIAGLPYFPNYRLGAEPGSACDTIGKQTNNEQILKVYPNPASQQITVDYGFTNWSKGQPILQICNILGQVVYKQLLPMYSGYQKIDISILAPGIYTVYVNQKAAVLAATKVVVD